jgi:hypothetical protein
VIIVEVFIKPRDFDGMMVDSVGQTVGVDEINCA